MLKLKYLILATVLTQSVFAGIHVKIGELYYCLDNATKTASVECRPYIDGDYADYEDGWMWYDAQQLYVGRVEVPDNVTCDGIDYVVTGLAPSAFAGSIYMQELSLPPSLTTIGAGAFSACKNLRSISVSDGNPVFSSLNGMLFTRKPVTLFLAPRWLQVATDFPAGLTEIPSSAFQYCGYITDIVVPEGVRRIKDGAMDNCVSLQSLSLPSSLTVIERNAFSACASLSQIVCYAEVPPTIVSTATTFDGVPKSTTIYVPVNSVESYRAAPGWSAFADIREMDEEMASVTHCQLPGTTPQRNGAYIENGKVVIVKNGRKYDVNGCLIH